MTEKDFNILMEQAERMLQEEVSNEEALRAFVRAGILDESGNLTPPYALLAVPSQEQAD